ncbi:MAG: hypothetical protein HRT61_04560 [Ekhidna sp.]|nr:hypothetical protein [Ekhidna sp.]
MEIEKGQENKPVLLDSDEIDLFDLLKKIWCRKLDIGKFIFVFIFLGIIIAFTTPKEYKASSVLIAESGSGGSPLDGLGGIASLAGVNIGGGSADSRSMSPELYQSVSHSTPFLMTLMEQQFYFADLNATIKLSDFFLEHAKSSLVGSALKLPGKLIGFFIGGEESAKSNTGNDIEILMISKEQTELLESLKNRISVEMDLKLNVVKIVVEMQDPVAAAQMVQFTQEYMTQYVTEYAISKSQMQLNSITKEYEQRKNEFENAQIRLATYRDKNKNVTSARVRSEEERLQSVYNLTFNIYNQLAQQKEAIKLQIEEDTPVFTVLEPVKVPVEKSKPKKSIILVGFTLVGGIFGVGYALLKIFLWEK